jgi:hypothetical protein
MQRQRWAGTMVVLGSLLFSLMFISMPVSAQTIEPGVMQTDEQKNLTYDQSRMFLYGSNNDGGPQSNWPMWTHSANTDTTSDDSLGEVNAPTEENNGGGPRTFTFDGTHPPPEAMPIDTEVPITGAVKLSIICNIEQDQCTKEMTIILRLGNRDLAQQVINEPDADGFYVFEFFLDDEEIPADETFGLRIQFQKPHQPTDGYTLYLGSGNAWMDIPVLPPYEETVPGLDDTEGYTSPYELASGFKTESANVTSWFGLIFWCLLSIAIFVAGFALLPPLPFKEISILLTGLGLLGAMFVAPLVSGPVLTGMAANPDDPDVWTIEELAQLEEREGTFLGDALTEGYKFTLYAEYDSIYTTKHEGQFISTLGFESDEDILGDPMVSRRGREYVQLYFSAFHADLRPGQAVLAQIEIVNISGVFVPKHADPETAMMIPVEIDGATSARFAIHGAAVTLVGDDFSWQYYPVLVTAVGLLLGGVGFWQVYKSRSDELDGASYDEDFEETLDEFEDDFDEFDDF